MRCVFELDSSTLIVGVVESKHFTPLPFFSLPTQLRSSRDKTSFLRHPCRRELADVQRQCEMYKHDPCSKRQCWQTVQKDDLLFTMMDQNLNKLCDHVAITILFTVETIHQIESGERGFQNSIACLTAARLANFTGGGKSPPTASATMTACARTRTSLPFPCAICATHDSPSWVTPMRVD